MTRIAPKPTEGGKVVDMIGIVTTLEGEPLPAGAIASRLGLLRRRRANLRKSPRPPILNSCRSSSAARTPAQQLPGLPEVLDAGGKIGLQHDPLLYGAYNLNPFLVAWNRSQCWWSNRARWP